MTRAVHMSSGHMYSAYGDVVKTFLRVFGVDRYAALGYHVS